MLEIAICEDEQADRECLHVLCSPKEKTYLRREVLWKV